MNDAERIGNMVITAWRLEDEKAQLQRDNARLLAMVDALTPQREQATGADDGEKGGD